MSTCKYCEQPIMEFSFTGGKRWMHLPHGWPDPSGNQTRICCLGRITEATPA
jgi:hypothetical protein